MDESELWRLPGPGAFVRAIATSVERKQNVAAILPRHYAVADGRSSHLVNAIVNELSLRGLSSRPIRPYEEDGPLIEALGFQVTGDDPPVTVLELLTHSDVADRVFVCDTSEFGSSHLGEVLRLLARLESESRTIPTPQRGVFVFVTDRGHVPEFAGGERSDVTFASHWYWNRVARWDAAALVAANSPVPHSATILHELRTETIVELARWDLDLAARLAAEWSGVEADLEDFVSPHTGLPAPDVTGPLLSHSEPGTALLEHWDAGLVGAWHERVEPSPEIAGSGGTPLSQRIWTAQSRVLLPWIEVRRQLLEDMVRGELGKDGFIAAIEYANRNREYDPVDPDAVEIGPLHWVVRTYLHRKHEWLTAARRLKDARNDLSHLRHLTQPRVASLIKNCSCLR